jgi:transcriptional regulator with XRE-family HTH domain
LFLSAAQVRGARGFLGWSARELADAAQLGLSTIQRLEAGGSITAANMAAIRGAMERAGVEFIAENGGGAGVRLAKPSAG